MKFGIVNRFLLSVLTLVFMAGGALGQERALETIPAGTKITVHNWQQYRQFMPDGMIALFEGKYFWKMPADVEMRIGPTRDYMPPPGYMAATEKYGDQTQVVQLPGGRYDLKNYTAGAPFPNPTEPNKGWKILADDWFGPRGWIMAATPETGLSTYCNQDNFHNVACGRYALVYRQLAFLAYPERPRTEAGANGAYFTEWVMVLEPEQFRYSAHLSIFYQDIKRDQDAYIFIPALRRSLRISMAARCADYEPMGDFTPDDMRQGFNGNVSMFQAQFLRDQRILGLTDLTTADFDFPEGWDMPLGWSMPPWGNWSLRDVWVIDVRRIPMLRPGYCYGKRVMYVDKHFYHELWTDLYDPNMKLWRMLSVAVSNRLVNGVMSSVMCSMAMQMWDLQRNHSTIAFTAAGRGRDLRVNDEVPRQYQDLRHYSEPRGLMEIMQ
jgi:hypothetical protein